MKHSPLELATVFTIGPVPITTPVVVTWAIVALLGLGGYLAARRLTLRPSRFQACIEMVVEAVASQITESLRGDPAPYLSLIGTLFLYILVANWASLIPGVEPPTAHIETDVALSLVVLVSAIYHGVRARGVGGYLRSFMEPTPLMLPLNIIEAFTRTFSMSVRLFGNVMSGVFIIGVVLSLAGLFVPIPLMALDLLTGAIQAYIFAILAIVFITSSIAEAPEPVISEGSKS
jgi:F-type H+-transporting ATPase subunit a